MTVRRLPIAPHAPPARRALPLATESRDVDRDARPTYASWEVTLACDLACGHCGSRAGRARPDELSTAECLDLVDQLAALGCRDVTLIGGEAYLRPDWLQIVERIAHTGMRPSMTTGGRGVTAELARDAVAAGLAFAGVSLDGHRAAHDRLRALAGSYDRALAAIDHFGAAGIGVSINSQVNRISAPTLVDMIPDVEARAPYSWRLALTVAMGRGADDPEVLLQPHDLLEVFPQLAALAQRSKVPIVAGNNIGYFGPYETLLRNAKGCHMSSCRAGITTMGIEADGAIKGCPSLPTEAWTGGNIRDASLAEIWERSAPLRVMRDRTVEDLWGYCRTCYYADECRAGCTWTGFSLFGKPGNNPYCHHRALEFDARGLRERVVQVEAAPGLPFDHGRFEIVVESRDGKSWTEAVSDLPASRS